MRSSVPVTPAYVAGPLRLHPFRAWRLAPARIGDPASARTFAPPYAQVHDRLDRWRATGQAEHDDEPALYLHEYTASGITIRGLVGALDVSRLASRPEDRAVLPHEGIYPAHADELADRMVQMELNPAPILLVQRAPAGARDLLRAVRAAPPGALFRDRNNQEHRVWAIREPRVLDGLAEELAPSKALIADGHHRYAAYLRMQQRAPDGPAGAGLAMVVDHDDTPLHLGPIHRVLGGTSLDALATATRSVGARFELLEQNAAVLALGPTSLVATDGERWAVLNLEVPPHRAAVELLHDLVVPALPSGPSRVGYHHSAEDALTQVTPEVGVAVLMPAPDVDLVLRIVAADRLLPEKATSFQPKPSLGVLMRSLRAG